MHRQEAMRDAFSGNVFADLAKRNMAMFEEAGRAFTGPAQKKPAAAPSAAASSCLQNKKRMPISIAL